MGPPELAIPWFTVSKFVPVDNTVIDMHCVWDCKRNGHNDSLWVPEFFIDGPREAEDHLIKWLVTPVKDYLEAGSPWLSYSIPGLYIKTE